MKLYTYGKKEQPVIMLIPGTCCHHSLFNRVVPFLQEYFYTIVVSFDGFDETEKTVYPTMTEETEKIEQYIIDNFDGSICCAYGCSLGGSFVSYMVQRKKVHIRHAVIGSSDMDEACSFVAKLEGKMMGAFMYQAIDTGHLPRWMNAINEKQMARNPEAAQYRRDFLGIFMNQELRNGVVKKESIYRQFYYDLITKIEDDIDIPDTEIHVFYALKMGKKYRKRYLRHFAHPDIREQNMKHEEFFFRYPQEWVAEILSCCNML